MELDRFEIEEFDNQYLHTYLLHEGKLVQVLNRENNKSASIKECVTGDRNVVAIKDLALFNPESGYYNLVSSDIKLPICFFMSREPVGRVQRGLSERNVDCQIPTSQDGGGVFWTDVRNVYPKFNSIFTSCLVQRPKDIRPVFEEFLKEKALIAKLDTRKFSISLALNQNLCAMKSKWGYSTILYHRQPVAFYLNGVVHLNRECDLHREQLTELNIGVVK